MAQIAEKSPFEIPTPDARQLVSVEPALRGKHWYRVIYRQSFDGGKTWSTGWWRFSPDVDEKSPSFHGHFFTWGEAVQAIKRDQARHARTQKRGKARIDLGGGLAADVPVQKGHVLQYRLLREVTLTLSDEIID